MIIVAYNPSTTSLEKSYLTADYPAGVTSIAVRNSDRFVGDSRIMIGELGNENTEIVTMNTASPDGVTLSITATRFPHTAADPVYVLRYDKIKFYRSTSGVEGSYSALSDGTVNIDVDNENLQTAYNDAIGLPIYYYKVSFYNSLTSMESSLSDHIPGSGYSRKQVGTLVQEFLQEIGDEQQEYITVPQIINLLNECNEDIIGQSRRPYRFLRKSVTANYSPTPISLTTVAPDMVKLDRIQFTNQDAAGSITSGNIDIISIEEMEYNQYNKTSIVGSPFATIIEAAIDETNNTIVFNPVPTTTKTGAIKIFYWGDFTYFSSLADTFQTPVKRIYKLFLLSRYYRMRAKKDTAFLNLSDRYNNDYSIEIVKLQRAQKLDVGTKQSFKPDARTRSGTLRRRFI